ncbi:MAG: 50S ribosomal protein L11 methyltransferase [Hyphomicrobiaceae bacterium]|nr:50S ribosomal protein L11 methyltransferase [Hyphomicrobiaceae bacterium]
MAAPRDDAADEAAIEAFTEIGRLALCPQIALRLKPTSEPFDRFRSRLPPRFGAAPPYWAVAWPGGQALARYLLDNAIVSGRIVLDLGAGCGAAAIAAGLSGARLVHAVDRDPLALAAVRVNARLNGVSIEAAESELARTKLEGVHAVLAGDLWYEPHIGRSATELLRRIAGEGVLVLAGDPGRSHFPRARRQLLGSYQVEVSEELEASAQVTAEVWQLLP